MIMTEETLLRELNTAQKHLQLWWQNKIPENSYPKKLMNKIKFLKAYINAIRKCQDDKEIDRVVRRIKGEYWDGQTFVSKF